MQEIDMSDWQVFRKELLDMINNSSSQLEDFLLNNKVKEYIFHNDRDKILGLIANLPSDKIRDFYFNEEDVNRLISLDKFQYNVLYLDNYYPNKIKLLKQPYFLESLIKRKYFLGMTLEYLIEEINSNNELKDLDISLKYKDVVQLMEYYLKNISAYLDILPSAFEKLPFELHKYLLLNDVDIIKSYANTVSFSLDFLFNSYFKGYEGKNRLDELLEIVDYYRECPNVCGSFKLSDNIINSFYRRFYFNNDRNGEVESYREKIVDYLNNKAVKLGFLKDSKYYDMDFSRLLFCSNIDIVKYYLDEEGIDILIKNDNKFSKLFKRDFDISFLFKEKYFAKALNENNVSKEKLDYYLNSTCSLNNIYDLLNNFLKNGYYEKFYYVFSYLNDEMQLGYLNRYKQLFVLNLSKTNLLLKGCKKSCYYVFSNYINYEEYSYSDYELHEILENVTFYDNRQLIDIFTNNVDNILNSESFSHLFVSILNLNIDEITDVYLSDDVQKKIRDNDLLKEMYRSLENLKCNYMKTFMIPENLQLVSNSTREDEKWFELSDATIRLYSYFVFFQSIYEIKNNELCFKLLDYFLLEDCNLTCFYKIRTSLDVDGLKEYFDSRREIITNFIKENSNGELYKIFEGLSEEILEKEITKDRECLVYGLDASTFKEIFYYKLDGSYKLDGDDYDVERLISVLDNVYFPYIDKVFTSDRIKKEIKEGIESYKKIRETVLELLNDNSNDFRDYLIIIYSSSYFERLDSKYITFINDIKELVFGHDYRKALELFEKYCGCDLEQIKLNILEEIENKSKESILSSLTDLSTCEETFEEHVVGDNKYKIRVIYFDGEDYQFLVRTMRSAEHLFNGNYVDKIDYYSTIYNDNRSMYYGNTYIKFGYCSMPLEDIVYMVPDDAICNNFDECKYGFKGALLPKWLSNDDFNRKTRAHGGYNEIRIKGLHIPDFVLSYDEPNDETVKYAGEHDVPMVKVLRKSYPNAIEFCEDSKGYFK